jgi:hypothetical protein
MSAAEAPALHPDADRPTPAALEASAIAPPLRVHRSLGGTGGARAPSGTAGSADPGDARAARSTTRGDIREGVANMMAGFAPRRMKRRSKPFVASRSR